MKKLVLLSMVVSLICLLGFAANGFTKDKSDDMTNQQLAQILAQKIGITLPAGSDYNALTNALAEKGISDFVNTKPGDFISCANLIDSVYAMVGGTGATDTKGKADYLLKNGYMNNCPADLSGQVSDQFAGHILNNTKINGVVGETYTDPGHGHNNDNPGQNAPGFEPENQHHHHDASPI